jgi:hypothetical protein
LYIIARIAEGIHLSAICGYATILSLPSRTIYRLNNHISSRRVCISEHRSSLALVIWLRRLSRSSANTTDERMLGEKDYLRGDGPVLDLRRDWDRQFSACLEVFMAILVVAGLVMGGIILLVARPRAATVPIRIRVRPRHRR